MLTTLTSWLRPSPSRRRPRPAAGGVRGVETLEDRAVPDATPAVLANAPYTQSWSLPGSYQSDWMAATQASVIGYDGSGLGAGGSGNAATLVDPGPGNVDLDLAATLTSPPGVGLFTGTLAGLDPVVVLKPATTPTSLSPFLQFYLDTRGVSDVFVDFRLRDFSTAANTQTVDVQYRTSVLSQFTTLSTVTPPVPTVPDATTGASQVVRVRLPAVANNKPLVQVRIITTNPSASGGAASWVGIDDIVIAGNKPPVVAPSGGTTTVDEAVGIDTTGTGVVDANINLTDADNNGLMHDPVAQRPGSLTVSILNPQAGDTLSINRQGNGPNQINLSGANVTYAGAAFGTYSFNPANTAVTFTFPAVNNPNDTVDGVAGTPTALRDLARSILFNTRNDTPSTAVRDVQFVADDGRGGTGTAIKPVRVRDRDDLPVITLPTIQPSTLQGVRLAVTGVAVGDVDLGAPTPPDPMNPLQGKLTLTVTVARTPTGTLSYTPLPGETVAYNVDRTQVVITFTGTGATTPFGASLGSRLEFIPNPGYNTAGDSPVPLIFDLNDNGSTGALNERMPFLPKRYTDAVQANLTVVVNPVNNPPVHDPDPLAAGPLDYALNSPAVLVAPDATVTDEDFPKSPDLNGGVLTVRVVGPGVSGDNVLRVRNQGFLPGQIGVVGQFPNTNVIYTPPTGPSVIVGQVSSSGTGTLPLQVTFNNAAATPDVVQAVYRNVLFSTSGTSFSTTPRTVQFDLTDGDGVGSPPSQTVASTQPVTLLYADNDRTRVVNPIAINNAPSFTLASPAPAAVAEDAGARTVAGFATNVSPGPAGYEAGQALAFVFRNNSNAALFAAGPAIDPATGNLTFTPAADQYGTATFEVALMDDGGTDAGGTDTSPYQTVTVTVTPVADTPVVTVPPGGTEDTPTAPVAVARNPVDGAEVTHVKITAPRGGTLFLADGTTPVADGTFLTVADATAGLVFRPAPDANSANTSGGLGFTAQASQSASDAGLGGAPAVVSIPVAPVDDAPALGGIGGTTGYLVGQPAVLVAPAATVADLDSPDLDTGVLTVATTGGAAATDEIAVQSGGNVAVVGTAVSVGGTTVGTASGGTGGADFTITFNAAATPAGVQEVLRNVTFTTTGAAGPRGLAVTLTDGDGGTSNTPATTVRVTNQVAVLSLARTDPSPTRAQATVRWLLTTDLPQSGFTAANFALTGSLAAAATLDPAVVPGSATTFTVTATLAPTAGSGTLGLRLADATGLAVEVSTPLPFDGEVYAVDRSGPAATAFANGDADGLVPLNQPVAYTVTFDEPVFDADAADFVNAGTAPVGIVVSSVTGNVVTLAVTPSGAGSLLLRVPTTATITDVLGNALVGPFTDPATVTVVGLAPTVASVTNNTAGPVANVTAPNAPVTYTVTFVSDVDAATVSAADFANGATTSPAAVTVGAVTRVSGVTYTVVVTPTTVGKVRLQVGPNLTDTAGNAMTAPALDPTEVTVNLAPAAVADTYTVLEDGALSVVAAGGVRGNDTDPNDAVATLSVDTAPVTAPTKGALTLRADGSFDYRPLPDANGVDTFTYRVRDPFGGSAVGTVTVTVTPVNDAPTFALAPTVAVTEDSGPYTSLTALVTNITAGGGTETDALVGFTVAVASADPTLTFSAAPAVTLFGSGASATGRLSFTPAPNAFGTATVTVRLRDGGGALNGGADTSPPQTFTLVVRPVNDAPTFALAGNPPVAGEDGGPQAVPAFATFSPGPNEDATGQTAVYTLTVSGAAGGLTFAAPPAISAGGTLTYTPAPDANGTATVTVRGGDSGGTADGGVDRSPFTQTFVIVVRAQNDLPVASPDGALVPKDGPATFLDVLANDTAAPDGSEVLTVASVTAPANGTATVAPGGRGVRYTPAAGFTGTDTFRYTITDGNGGPATATVTVTVRPVPAGQPLFDEVAVGTGPGGAPVVRVNSLSTGAFTATFFAYDPSFRGGVNVAVGDVNGDGVPDIVTTPGFGGGPHVKVIDGAKLGLIGADGMISEDAVLASFFAYRPNFTGGVTVTVADVNGDGIAEIITGTGPGGGAHVKVIDGSRLGEPTIAGGEVSPDILLASFFAYDPSFRGGVNVAAGDVDGDGVVDIVTAAGAGGGSHVKVFDGLGGQPLLRSFFAYGGTFTGGVNIAAGDVNGDGLADLITGAGVGGGPHVKVFDSSGDERASFFGLSGGAAGADVAFRVTASGVPLVAVGGQRGGSQVRTYAAPDFLPYNGFDAYDPSFLGGVEVG